MRLETFQMISKVVAFDRVGNTLQAIAHVPQTSPVFEGHFPSYPLLPGVLMIEAMAQTSGWLIMGANQFSAMPFLAAVGEAKMRDFVKPETTLEVFAALIHEGSGFAKTKAKILREGKLIANSELTFKTMPFPAPEFQAMIKDNGVKLGFPFND